MFKLIHILDMILFILLPVILLLFTIYLYRKRFYKLFGSCLLLSAFIIFIGIYSHYIEPYWIKVNEVDILSNKISQKYKIVVLADIQTDKIGKYEKKVVQKTINLSPHLILFAGDYIQQPDYKMRKVQINKFNKLLKNSKIIPKYGAYAIKGNVDSTDWKDIFKDTNTTLLENTESIEINEISLTGLGLSDSLNDKLYFNLNENRFNIVLGHIPNFALGYNNADLLLAGHTHGGQVRLPFIGPLLTFSSIPKSWASGLTKIKEDKYLYVSSGIGTEQSHVPPIRFLCRPEIVVINLIPDL